MIKNKIMLPKTPIKTFVLKNGLRVVVVEDHSVPVVSVAVVYDVGARAERPGRSGFAHLFEHMMFQGSANVDKTGHMRLIESQGGVLNGFTMKDFTAYYETLPSNRLALGLWLEADRMKSLAVTQENFDNQKDVVQEEKRWRYDNRPYMTALNEEFPKLLFSRWENQHSVIGSMKDLDESTLEDIREFFNAHYVPANAVVVVAGDARTQEVKKFAEKYFSGIPGRSKPVHHDLSEQASAGGRQQTYQDRFAALPVLMVGWPAPPRSSPHYKALEFLGSVLSEGDDSRLHQLLVKTKEWALGVSGGMGWPFGNVFTLRDPAPFGLMAHLKPGVDSRDVLDAIRREIAAIAGGSLTEEEMVRSRRKFQAGILDQFQGTETRAYWLGIYTHLNGGNPQGFESELNAYLSGISREMVMKAAGAGYFEEGKQSVLLVEPDPSKAGATQAQAARPKASSGNGHPATEAAKREQPPLQGAPKKTTQKKIVSWRLANGFNIVLIRDQRLPFIKARLLFPALNEGQTGPGMAQAQAMAHLLKAGTSRMNNAQIESALAGMGASLGAGAGHDYFHLSGSVLSATSGDFFKLLTELLTDSVFPENELELWRANTLEELKDERSRPEFLRDERWSAEVFGRHPYSLVSPSPDQVRAVSRGEVLGIYRRQFNPGQGTLVLVGDAAPADLKKLLSATLGKLARPKPPALRASKNPPFPAAAAKPRIVIVDRPASAQSEIVLGHLSIKRAHPDYYNLVLGNAVLGVTFDSRLNRKLREEKGYTYGAGSAIGRYLQTGTFKVKTAVRTEVTAPALAEIFDELKRIRESGIKDEELSLAKNYLAGADAIAQGTQDYLADKIAEYCSLGVAAAEINRFRGKILGVSRKKAESAVRKHMNPGAAVVVVVGDAAKIAGPLERFGAIEIYDAQGVKLSGRTHAAVSSA
ncbi:MAG: insulinase family protein [Elusimicrobia bacterium]|nr:insulinase family protein [Elusimicrobiota bacterium]